MCDTQTVAFSFWTQVRTQRFVLVLCRLICLLKLCTKLFLLSDISRGFRFRHNPLNCFKCSSRSESAVKTKKNFSAAAVLLPSCFLSWSEELPGFRLSPLQALVALLRPLLQQRDTGASHGYGDVDLSVRVAAADAGACSPQDDGGSVDQGAAILTALLAVRSDQAALAQAVGLGDVAGISLWVVWDPENVFRMFNAMAETAWYMNCIYKQDIFVLYIFLEKKEPCKISCDKIWALRELLLMSFLSLPNILDIGLGRWSLSC